MPRAGKKSQKRSGARAQNVDGLLRVTAGAENLRTSNVGTGHVTTPTPGPAFIIQAVNPASGATAGAQTLGSNPGATTSGPDTNLASSSGSNPPPGGVVATSAVQQRPAPNVIRQLPPLTAVLATAVQAAPNAVPQPPPGVSLPAGFTTMASHAMLPPPRPAPQTPVGPGPAIPSPAMNQGVPEAVQHLRESSLPLERANAATQTNEEAQETPKSPEVTQEWEPVSGVAAFIYTIGNLRFWKGMVINIRQRAAGLRSQMKVGRLVYRGVMLESKKGRPSQEMPKLMLYLEVRGAVRVLAVVLFLMYLELPWFVYRILRDLAIFVLIAVLYVQSF